VDEEGGMDLCDRIREAAEELCAIQNELNRLLMLGIAEGDGSPALREAGALDGVSDLKLIVDQLRQFLWFYMQVTSGSEAGEESAHILRKIANDPRIGQSVNALTFFRQLNGNIEYALVHIGSRGRKPN